MRYGQAAEDGLVAKGRTMMASTVYVQRRERLREELRSGLIVLLGNELSPMNYAHNPYPFRQDSSFLYFFGLDEPGLAAAIDIEEGRELLFGQDATEDDLVWTVPPAPLRERAVGVGVGEAASLEKLGEVVGRARALNRPIHFLPQYRAENVLRLQQLLSLSLSAVQEGASVPLIRAIIAQRSVKSADEVAEIEQALSVSRLMHLEAMRMAKPGRKEYEVAGALEGLALSHGARLAFPIIFSRHGEVLHNPCYGNTLKAGDLVVHDSGVESPLHYASDITRTFPVGGNFSAEQKALYAIVLEAQAQAIQAVRPGTLFRDIHALAGRVLLAGLGELGVIRGEAEAALRAQAHTLFFPCGLGHMLGLDVHDMEGLGEDLVGYTDAIRRSPEFGWRWLRLAKALQPGFVLTVEPGIYFNPLLIDLWQSQGKCAAFINYERLKQFRHLGGVRVEDNVLVTGDGHRVLGPPIPKALAEVEACASGAV